MNSDRRGFIGALGGLIGAVGAIEVPKLVVPTAPDDFEHRGFRIRWRGWRQSPNQCVLFGIWTANRLGSPEPFAVLTTGGSRYVCQTRFWVFDTTQHDDWPSMADVADDPALAEIAKAKARAEMIRAIDDGSCQKELSA